MSIGSDEGGTLMQAPRSPGQDLAAGIVLGGTLAVLQPNVQIV
jgi:hypothetical protein